MRKQVDSFLVIYCSVIIHHFIVQTFPHSGGRLDSTDLLLIHCGCVVLGE